MSHNKLEVTCEGGDASTGKIIVSEGNKVKKYPAVIFVPESTKELYDAIDKVVRRYKKH